MVRPQSDLRAPPTSAITAMLLLAAAVAVAVSSHGAANVVPIELDSHHFITSNGPQQQMVALFTPG